MVHLAVHFRGVVLPVDDCEAFLEGVVGFLRAVAGLFGCCWLVAPRPFVAVLRRDFVPFCGVLGVPGILGDEELNPWLDLRPRGVLDVDSVLEWVAAAVLWRLADERLLIDPKTKKEKKIT